MHATICKWLPRVSSFQPWWWDSCINFGSQDFEFWTIRFLAKIIWKFSRRSVSIWEHIKNNTPYRLYADGSRKGPLSNGCSLIARKFEKIPTNQHFCLQIIMMIMRIIFYIYLQLLETINNCKVEAYGVFFSAKKMSPSYKVH